MIDHRAVLDLASAALDWDLTPTERAHVTTHLSTCDRCRHQVEVTESQARAIRSLAFADAPARIRPVVVSAALHRGPLVRRRTLALMVAAALLLLAAFASVALVGSYLRELQRENNVVDPPPTLVQRPAQLAWSSVSFAGDLATKADLGPLVAGGAGFVLFGWLEPAQASTGTIVVWSSKNGSDWVEDPQPPEAFGGSRPSHVIALGSRLIAFTDGAALADGISEAWVSDDGRTWTTGTASGPGLGVVAAAASQGTAIACGERPPATFACSTSVDGLGWQPAPVPSGGSGKDLRSIVSTDDGFVAYTSTPEGGSIWTYRDGVWVAQEIDTSLQRASIDTFVAGGGSVVAVGSIVERDRRLGDRTLLAIWVASDGATWERAIVPVEVAPGLKVAHVGTEFVGIGSGEPLVVASVDGRTWAIQRSPGPPRAVEALVSTGDKVVALELNDLPFGRNWWIGVEVTGP
jgi:hypothetical protein